MSNEHRYTYTINESERGVPTSVTLTDYADPNRPTQTQMGIATACNYCDDGQLAHDLRGACIGLHVTEIPDGIDWAGHWPVIDREGRVLRISEGEPGEELCDWDADAGAPVHVGDGSDALLDT
jgi:hypothetical protein